eukprot:4427805-Lingulodinium_polyedra.AAC.1
MLPGHFAPQGRQISALQNRARVGQHIQRPGEGSPARRPLTGRQPPEAPPLAPDAGAGHQRGAGGR